jgi:hypothetical protein
MRRVAKVTRNPDNTWTIRVGNQVEHFSIEGKTRVQIFEHIRWSLVSMGVTLSEIDLIELMHNEENQGSN